MLYCDIRITTNVSLAYPYAPFPILCR